MHIFAKTSFMHTVKWRAKRQIVIPKIGDLRTICIIKKTSTKGISSIKSEMGILIIYSYSVIDVRTWWFGWVQEIQEAIFKRKHSSSALLHRGWCIKFATGLNIINLHFMFKFLSKWRYKHFQHLEMTVWILFLWKILISVFIFWLAQKLWPKTQIYDI